jgi:hypothetical protein
MSPADEAKVQPSPDYRRWLRGTMIVLALLTMARFVLEIAGVSHHTARYFSTTMAMPLAAIYLGAVAPLRGVRKFSQLILPAFGVAAWAIAWIILFTLISGVGRLERSHFAEPQDWGNWSNLGWHLLGHVIEIPVVGAVMLLLMAALFFARRWPLAVGPVAVLGALTIIRITAEAMSLAPTTSAAWSSTVAMLLCALYLGGVGPRLTSGGAATAGQLFLPALVVGWAWRFWIFLAALFSALAPFYKTHFFDPSQGHVPARLAEALAGSVIVAGFVAGLVVWGIAVWIARSTRPSAG